MKDRAQIYTLPLDFEMAYTLADTGEWDSFDIENGKLVHRGVTEQIVGYLNKLDEELLAESLSIFKFLEKECMQVRVRCSGAEVICSKIIKGKRKSVSSASEIKSIIHDLVFQARKKGRDIQYVEVVHTHLGRQSLTVTNGKVTQLETHALSQRDLNCVNEIKEFVDFPIKIKAITQEKMSYSKLVA